MADSDSFCAKYMFYFFGAYVGVFFTLDFLKLDIKNCNILPLYHDIVFIWALLHFMCNTVCYCL